MYVDLLRLKNKRSNQSNGQTHLRSFEWFWSWTLYASANPTTHDISNRYCTGVPFRSDPIQTVANVQAVAPHASCRLALNRTILQHIKKKNRADTPTEIRIFKFLKWLTFRVLFLFLFNCRWPVLTFHVLFLIPICDQYVIRIIMMPRGRKNVKRAWECFAHCTGFFGEILL